MAGRQNEIGLRLRREWPYFRQSSFTIRALSSNELRSEAATGSRLQISAARVRSPFSTRISGSGPPSRLERSVDHGSKDYVFGSGNVFEDLGHPRPAEALAKAELAPKIAALIAKRRLTQAAAAELIQIDQPKGIGGCRSSRSPLRSPWFTFTSSWLRGEW